MERKIKFAPEEYYHLYSRGVEKRKIFIRHQDYQRFMFGKINHKKDADKFLASYEYSSFPEYNAVKRSQSKILNLQLIPYYLLHTDFSAEDYFKILNKYSKDEEIIEGYPQ